MKTAGKIMKVLLILALAAIILKIYSIEGSSLLFVLSSLLLGILAFVQFFLFLIKINNNKFLKVTGALLSYVFSVSFMGILFRFQFWEGYGLMMISGTLPLIILTIIFIANLSKIPMDEYRSLIKTNLFFPWCFIVFFTAIHYILPAETFYNTFGFQRNEMSYEEFISGADSNPDQSADSEPDVEDYEGE